MVLVRVKYSSLAAAAILGLLGSALADIAVDRTSVANTFDGIGGISGGGATSVLLPHYAEPSRSQILDYLFKPNFGASLQTLKVEIGGDSQSTDGTESSHMHDAETVNLHTGYEWWLMQEAKARNPDIKIYGLAWAFPGWVGNGSGSPFDFPDQTSKYLVGWVKGAKHEYGLDVDYLGIWNERSSDSTFVQTLRKTLNNAGHTDTKLVVKDGGADICDDLAKDKAYADAVDIIGLHYPSDFKDYSVCHSLGKPIWASEESSSYDDLNGAACWGRVINSHWVINQMTSSLMWNLVGAYYHGTNWYASSMLTSVEPWSGHYEVNPVIWATAHVTQFTKIGWKYLANQSGSGELAHGGYYTTWVDPESSDFTMNVVKISHDHAACTRPPLPYFAVKEETVTFALAASMHAPAELQVWYSNFETYNSEPPLFQHSTIEVQDGKFTLKVPVGSMFTITTLKTGQKGGFDGIPTSSPSFPLDYHDDFQSTAESENAKLFADQIGAFEVHTAADGRKSLKQMVPALPIGWSDHGSNGPVTIIGMREWQDVSVSVAFKLPEAKDAGRRLPASPVAPDAACVAARADQMWQNGVALCIDVHGMWTLAHQGPAMQGGKLPPPQPVAQGRATTAVGAGVWHTLTISVSQANLARGSLDSEDLFDAVGVRDMDTGFAAIGANGFFAIEFRNFSVTKMSKGWAPPVSCKAPIVGSVLSARPCARNGLSSSEQRWNLLPSYQLQHVDSKLCASAEQAGPVTLKPCNASQPGQLFVNDYTTIRNGVVQVTAKALKQPLVGNKAGQVLAGSTGDWKKWSYFPNTQQLRNQYVADPDLGYPLCLSACAAQEEEIVV